MLDLNPHIERWKALLSSVTNPFMADENVFRSVFALARAKARPDEFYGLPLCVVQHLGIQWKPNQLIGGGFDKEGRCFWRLVFVFEVLNDGAGLTGPDGALVAAALVFDEIANWTIDDSGHRIDVDSGPDPFDVQMLLDDASDDVPPPQVSAYALEVSHSITYER